ncbi:MAG: EamA family transporter [Bradyrhizobium sp.]|nr:EamA family transporter [Bradyrhizobium sp.]
MTAIDAQPSPVNPIYTRRRRTDIVVRGLCFAAAAFGVTWLALILFTTGQLTSPGPISTKSWIFLALSALGTGASWLCYFRALKLGPATLVAPIDKLSVVLVALFGVVFLGERPSLQGWIGIGLIACGAVLIAIKS